MGLASDAEAGTEPGLWGHEVGVTLVFALPDWRLPVD